MVEKHNAMASTFMGACLALTQPALAQTAEPIGALVASIDGSSYQGETLSVPSEGSATASFQSFGPVTRVTIQAHDPEAERDCQLVFAYLRGARPLPVRRSFRQHSLSRGRKHRTWRVGMRWRRVGSVVGEKRC